MPGELKKIRSDGELGLFVRSIVGLDRQAAKRAFDGFVTGKTLTANQIQFVNLVVDYLTQAGWMSAAQLYESPFTDYSTKGVEGIFNSEQVTHLVQDSGQYSRKSDRVNRLSKSNQSISSLAVS